MNQYVTTTSWQATAKTSSVSKRRTQAKAGVASLSGFEKWTMGLSLLAIIGLILGNLWLQHQSQQLQAQIETHQAAISDLRAEEDHLLSQIMETYNFELLQEIAEEQGMTIDKSRIKEVTRP